MLSHEELDALQCMAAVFAGKTECGLDHRKIGDSGAKVPRWSLRVHIPSRCFSGINAEKLR